MSVGLNSDQINAWLHIYSEQMKYARHHELLRERSTHIILIIAGALIAALKVPGYFDIAQVPISISLIVLGLFGALLSLKQYEGLPNLQILTASSNHYPSGIIFISDTDTSNTQMPTSIR